MAKNDRILLDGIIDERILNKLPSEKRDEAFEYLAMEQILKDLDLATDEILYGSIDGRGDGGIDGFFIIVNGHLLQDVESFTWPKSSSELRLILISCKHHDTFKQSTLDSVIATLTELLDFSIDESGLTGAYSEDLLRMRRNLIFAYRKLSPRLKDFSVDVYYASRGDSSELGEEVRARGIQIARIAEESFGSCASRFSFIGATELVELHRKIPNYTLEIPFVEALSKGERYVVLVKISDYYQFISDQGKLRRYLFDSNVRDFMGLNRVNEDIKKTLQDNNSPDFWWLNNGVTILATSAAITGKSIQVSDVQIVNGLQTTESIFRHFESSPEMTDDRCVLVKVIISEEEAIRDAIIRATNNQTDVELASLHATDKIQRDIEDVMLRHGLFYERRKNHYANQGHLPSELVTPLYAAAGYVALVLKRPHSAVSLRSKFMRSKNSYELVFNEYAPINVWPKIVHILKKVDSELESVRPKTNAADRFLKGWRYITAFLVLAKHFKKFMYSASELSALDISLITSDDVKQIWLQLNEQESINSRMGGWNIHKNVLTACEKLASQHGIVDIKAISGIMNDFSYSPREFNPKISITDEFVEKVRNLLPAQPWKPGIHREICSKLGCGSQVYFAAAEKLIEDGVFFRQRDGVLYDIDGNVVGVDTERVNPNTLELLTPKT